jgi:Rieske Fe-S protein
MEDQPGWRHDFPIDWPQDHYVARRDFTKFLVLTSFAFAVGQFWIGVQNWIRRRRGDPPIVKVADAGSLPIGQTKPFNYPGENDPCVLVRLTDDRFVAFGQKCTHLACAVVPEFDAGHFYCPCHKGYFDLQTGKPLAGPPRRPLPEVQLRVRGEAIYATGVALRTT